MKIDDGALAMVIDDLLTAKFSTSSRDDLRDKVHTHPITPEIKLETLRVVANEIFERRRVRIANELKASQILELIALVMSKTYAECGDSFQLADDRALIMICDLLYQHDPFIFKRYKNKHLSQRALIKEFYTSIE